MLKVSNLSVVLSGRQVLSDVNLDVSTGEIVTLVGANGAGKSTLLNTIVGALSPSQGAISLDDFTLNDLSMAARIRSLGIVLCPEGRRVFPALDVSGNLRLGAMATKGRILKEKIFSLERVLELFPALRVRMKQLAGTLSGGEQQMLAIGRSLMGEPRLLMLDEPSQGLAPTIVAEVMGVIRTLREETRIAVLLVEQNVEAALKVADRGYVFESGVIVGSGTSDSLRSDAIVRRAYLGG